MYSWLLAHNSRLASLTRREISRGIMVINIEGGGQTSEYQSKDSIPEIWRCKILASLLSALLQTKPLFHAHYYFYFIIIIIIFIYSCHKLKLIGCVSLAWIGEFLLQFTHSPPIFLPSFRFCVLFHHHLLFKFHR